MLINHLICFKFSASLARLFVQLRGDTLVSGTTLSAGDGEQQSTTLRRATTVIKAMHNPLALKRRSHPAMVKVQMVRFMKNIYVIN
jgi:hypothetical protein